MTLHLVDQFDEAIVRAPSAAHVQVQTFVIAGRSLTTVYQRPHSRITWPAITPGAGTRLEFDIAVKPSVWDKISGPVRFAVRAHDDVLFERTLDPRKQAADRAWLRGTVELGSYAGRSISLSFETRGEQGRVSFDLVGWGDPRLLDMPERALVAHPPESLRPDVYLITCDALRVDHLSCYNAKAHPTPNIDALARDGMLVRHARTPTDTTLGAYISMLAGAPSHVTKVNAEWGRFPAYLPALPQVFAADGYHTLLAVSEDELADNRVGIGQLFAEEVPCLGNPAQHSSLTMRRLLSHLDELPAPIASKPRFVWIELFEPHPPVMPEEEFARAHWQGDSASANRADVVRRIQGIETSLDLLQGRAERSAGRLSPTLLLRLEDTVRALGNPAIKGPDLASHLFALGEPAWRGFTLEAFTQWLEAATIEARANDRRASDELLQWLDEVERLLQPTSHDLLTWLKGVENLQYPLALYAAAVSSVDAQIGKLIEHLKRTGRYENALIVFTAPHGEFLADEPAIFEHHALSEIVLRVPLIMKMPRGAGVPPVASAAGILPADLGRNAPSTSKQAECPCHWPREAPGPICLTDLAATIADIANVPALGALSRERSCVAQLLGKTTSRGFAALGMSALTSSWYEEPFKLIRRHMQGVAWPWCESDAKFLLFHQDDEAQDVSAEHPDVAARLCEHLEAAAPEAECVQSPLVSGRVITRLGPETHEGERTTASRHEHFATMARKRLEKDHEALHRDLRQLEHIVGHLRSGIEHLFASRRWRLVNLLRSSRVSYAPVDRWLKRLDEWLARRPALAAVDQSYAAWLSSHRPDMVKLAAQCAALSSPPRFGILLHVPEDAVPEFVARALKSVSAQSYANWRLFVVGAGTLPSDERMVAGAPTLSEDITHWTSLGAEDWIEPHALMEVAIKVAADASLDLIFTDEDEVTKRDELQNPFFKPGWSPETLESLNCVGALAVYRAGFLRALGIGAESLHEGNAYDLALRAVESKGLHSTRIPSVLYHRRTRDSRGLERDRKALEQALQRRGEPAQVRVRRDTGTFVVERPVIVRERVTIFIPTRDYLPLLRRCIDTLTAITSYDNYEIVIIDNDSSDPAALAWMETCGHRVFRYPGAFNYAAMHNAAVRTTTSPWIVFLNNDTEIIDPQWLSVMAAQVQRPEIGTVGAKLLYPDGSVQHAGVVLGILGRAAHAFAGKSPDDTSDHAQLQITRNYSAVTAACMMMRRAVFEKIGGFDEAKFAVAYNDVELCVRALRHGYRSVYVPQAVLLHHECATRSRRDHPEEVAALRASCMAGAGWCDPYYHPALNHHSADFRRM